MRTYDLTDWDHFLLWDTRATGDRSDSGIESFSGPAELDREQVDLFGTLVEASRLWLPEADSAVTRQQRSGEESKGWPGTGLCVLNYLVVKGDAKAAASLRDEIDWSSLDGADYDGVEGAHLDAYSTSTVFDLAAVPAAMILLWARVPSDEEIPELPVELVIDLVHGLNKWGRSLKERDLLLDSARLNVRVQGRRLGASEGPGRHPGPGRLVAQGIYPRDNSAADALRDSGLDPDRYLVEIATDNPWWAPVGDAPPYYDDPRNSILV